jgi:predicted N-acetyltransferase YhbS
LRGGFGPDAKCRGSQGKVKNYLPNRYAAKACQNLTCLRGQRLFVRPIEAGDAEAIRSFFTSQQAGEAVIPACGLLGKVVGDIVAVMAIEIADDVLVVHDLYVARELRRKRIGRFLAGEAAQLAAKLERTAVVVSDARGSEEFLRRVGFVSEDGLFVRRVG